MRRVCPSCDAPVVGAPVTCRGCGGGAPPGGWPDDAWVGRVIGGEYTLTRRVGAGSHGIVFAASRGERDAEEVVALKVLRPTRVDRGRRFLEEAESARAVRSPHTLAVLGVGHTEEGLPYLVMPLLRGASLASRLERGPLPRARALTIAASLADALAAIHDAGLVHRDLKPANVFVGARGAVTLLDFGIARRERELAAGLATLAGTPAYMAPEHRSGEPIDGRADVYALGVLVHEMLTGQRPSDARGVLVDGELGGFIARCLADLPEERPSARHAAQRFRGGVIGARASRSALPPTLDGPAARTERTRRPRDAANAGSSERAAHWHRKEARGWIALSAHLRPIYVMTIVGDVSEAAYAACLDAATEMMLGPDEPYAFVGDATRSGALSARHRRLQAQWLEAHRPAVERLNCGAAFAIASAVQRGVLTAIFWVQPPRDEVKVTASRREALAWACDRLAERGVSPPSLEADAPYDGADEPPVSSRSRAAGGL